MANKKLLMSSLWAPWASRQFSSPRASLPSSQVSHPSRSEIANGWHAVEGSLFQSKFPDPVSGAREGLGWGVGPWCRGGQVTDLVGAFPGTHKESRRGALAQAQGSVGLPTISARPSSSSSFHPR